MPIEKTYYEILGVPRTATPEQIKRRYRQLVRKYHPDVAPDKSAAKSAFIQITEAYDCLINPDRRLIYDASLDAEMFRIKPPASNHTRSAEPVRERQTTRRPPGPISNAQRLIQEAQMAFIRGQFRAAIVACKEAQKLDPRNLQAHIILGDIYRIQGRLEDAIAMYSIVLQLDPANAEIRNKLDRLLRRGGSGQASSTERQAVLRVGLNLMGWSIAASLLFLLALSPGEPVQWLQQNMPFLGVWTNTLFAVLAIVGVLTGFLLSVNETLQPLDEELVFQSIRGSSPRQSYPVGLLLVVFTFFNFYVAAGIYALIAWAQESVSRSILRAFAAAFVIIALASLMYSNDSTGVLLFGGNVVFPTLLFGWALGDMFRPSW